MSPSSWVESVRQIWGAVGACRVRVTMLQLLPCYSNPYLPTHPCAPLAHLYHNSAPAVLLQFLISHRPPLPASRSASFSLVDPFPLRSRGRPSASVQSYITFRSADRSGCSQYADTWQNRLFQSPFFLVQVRRPPPPVHPLPNLAPLLPSSSPEADPPCWARAHARWKPPALIGHAYIAR